MGGEDETIKLVLYIVVMIIVIYIGIGLVLGFNPSEWTRKLSSTTFTSGKIGVTQDLEKNTVIGCLQTAYLVTLKDMKFDIKPGLETQDGKLQFIVVMDFRNLLFIGSDNDYNEIIKCPLDGGEFKCGDKTLSFDLRNTGGLGEKEVFHFTTWYARPVLVDAIKSPEFCEDTPSGTVCSPTSISKILDNYGQLYLSSFDVVKDKINTVECNKNECEKQADESDCKSTARCYWHGFNGCELCPTSTTCGDYDGYACSQCAIPKANCKPGTFYGCNIP